MEKKVSGKEKKKEKCDCVQQHFMLKYSYIIKLVKECYKWKKL